MNKKELKKAREVVSMANMNGWEQVEKFIKSKIKPIDKELNNNFELDKSEFDSLRKQKQAYENILNFVNRRIKEVKNHN